MTRLSTRAIVTALLLVGIGSPGFAQSSDHNYKSVAHHTRQYNAVTHWNGFNSFGMASSIGVDPSAPARTGGGSIGYNANVLKDQ